MNSVNGDTRYRVYNECIYDIGVKLMSGIDVVIKPYSFQLLTVNDILYIESICATRKFFGEKMLVAKDMSGKVVPFEELGLIESDSDNKHYSKEEIEAALKQTAKKIEAWIENITEPSELHAIIEVAKEMDLSASKLKILTAKVPDAEIL